MKTLTFIVISGVLLASSALADEASQHLQPTLAALESRQQTVWQLPEQSFQSAKQEKNQLDVDAEKLNAQIESELDTRLKDKLNQQLKFNF